MFKGTLTTVRRQKEVKRSSVVRRGKKDGLLPSGREIREWQKLREQTKKKCRLKKWDAPGNPEIEAGQVQEGAIHIVGGRKTVMPDWLRSTQKKKIPLLRREKG